MNNLVIITSYIESISDDFFENITADHIICLDGGYDIAVEKNLVPNIVLGDLDSLSGELPENVIVEQFPPEKDYTDLELGLKKACALGADNVTILGGIGGRLDHTMANIQLLSQYTDKFNSLTMKDASNKCYVLNKLQMKGTHIPYESESYFSVFSLSETCDGLTISDAKYPLKNHTLPREGSLCVSNEFTNKKDAFISLNEGTLLVIISKR